MVDLSTTIIRNALGKKVNKRQSYGRVGYDRDDEDEECEKD